jgi:hypothetical protein
MNHLRATVGLVLLLSSGPVPLEAQGTLYVKERSGGQTPYALSGIRRLDFTGGTLNVTLTSSVVQTFVPGDVRFLSFRNYFEGIPDPGGTAFIRPTVYPNPVNSLLHVEYSGNSFTGGILEIFDLQGRVQQREYFQGTGAVIDVSGLGSGLFLILLRDQFNQNGTKFIKD